MRPYGLGRIAMRPYGVGRIAMRPYGVRCVGADGDTRIAHVARAAMLGDAWQCLATHCHASLHGFFFFLDAHGVFVTHQHHKIHALW